MVCTSLSYASRGEMPKAEGAKADTMAHDEAYKQAEQKIQTMIEGLQDVPDFKNQGNPNQGNQVNQG